MTRPRESARSGHVAQDGSAMARLICSALASLDGYIADEHGRFDWAVPDEEVLAFINELERPVGTHLYGRRLYELMTGWETDPALAEHSPAMGEFARLWRAADKIVYSGTLDTVVTTRTRIERTFDVEAVRRLKNSAERDLAVGGPELAAHAFEAGLVDECGLFFAPVLVGGGKSFFPRGVSAELELLDQRRFGNGMVHVRYRLR
nr:dihydrofolate reductase family protein [Actinopolyspora alba]